jgi:hypothetical protein
MPQYTTEFASIDAYRKGRVSCIDDSAKNYVFSNMFDVAARSAPNERVAIAKNFEYVIEAMRAEGGSPWYTAAHDEFAVAMDHEVEVHLVKLDDPDAVVDPESEGAHRLAGEPQGRKMGWVRLKRGHMTLLPVGAAYQFRANRSATVMIQTIDGPETIHRWADICQN